MHDRAEAIHSSAGHFTRHESLLNDINLFQDMGQLTGSLGIRNGSIQDQEGISKGRRRAIFFR